MQESQISRSTSGVLHTRQKFYIFWKMTAWFDGELKTSDFYMPLSDSVARCGLTRYSDHSRRYRLGDLSRTSWSTEISSCPSWCLLLFRDRSCQCHQYETSSAMWSYICFGRSESVACRGSRWFFKKQTTIKSYYKLEGHVITQLKGHPPT